VNQINSAVNGGSGTLTSRAVSPTNDFNRNNFVFQTPAKTNAAF